MKPPILVWFRHDLRIADNPALSEATDSGHPVVPVFILDPKAGRAAGAASLWWLHQSLNSLAQQFQKLRTPLLLRRGDSVDVLTALAKETGAQTIHWNETSDATLAAFDRAATAALADQGLTARAFLGSALLHEPLGGLRTREGKPFQVFTPFWRAALDRMPPGLPLPAPKKLLPCEVQLKSERLEDWRLLPIKPDWAEGFREAWEPGEVNAAARLEYFLEDRAASYGDARNFPARDGHSGLSPHLHFGEVTPRQIWHRADTAKNAAFLREVGWRDFCQNLLHHFPTMAAEPLRSEFKRFPWREDAEALRAWQRGLTGYPLVDAGMRELWRTGFMHNRVRMVVASFLVKHLLLHWRHGEAWFWDTLVDADHGNNVANWQWIAGCGADAAPYFRIFNPVLQGERFDPQGAYVRRWVPELAELPDRFIHHPWDASVIELEAAGIRLGKTYPSPIVEHDGARKRALAAFARLKESRPG